MQIECDDVFHVPNLQMAKAFRLTSQTTTTIIIILNCFSPDTQLMHFPVPLHNSIDELKEEHHKKSCDSLKHHRYVHHVICGLLPAIIPKTHDSVPSWNDCYSYLMAESLVYCALLLCS